MAFCGKCGSKVEAGEKFCPNCGAAVGQAESAANKIGDVLNTEDETGMYGAQDINENKGISVLSYIGILCLIPLLTKKDSGFAQFHARQGVTLCAISIVGSIIFWILTAIFAKLKVIAILLGIVQWAFSVCILVLAIIGIVNVVNGKAKKLPVIGNFDVVGMFVK